jgi:VCBS repeat-containing protein
MRITGRKLAVFALVLIFSIGLLAGSGFSETTWTLVDGGGIKNTASITDQRKISFAEYNGWLYVAWTENATVREVHIKKYNGSGSWVNAGPSSSKLSDDANDAYSPALAMYNGSLYAAYTQKNEYWGNYSIRVKKLTGTTWTSAGIPVNSDRKLENLNYVFNANAYQPTLMAHGGYLYAAWIENANSSYDKKQLRVSRYDDSGWSRIDGGVANVGLNINNATDNDLDASYPSFAVYDDKLYIGWEETTSSSIYQVHVKRYDGDHNWELIDGGASGLNWGADTLFISGQPVMTGSSGGLFASWNEASYDDPTWGLTTQVRLKKYIGSWSFIDGGTSVGLNAQPDFPATSPALVSYYDNLYLAWEETAEVTGGSVVSQTRVAKFGLSSPFIDNSSINFNTSNNAYKPNLTAYKGELYAAWYELTGSGTPEQIRIKKTGLPPAVSIPVIGTVSATQATIAGSVTYSSGGSVSVYGVQYKKHSDDVYITAPNLSGPSGSFSATLTGLSPLTTYDVRPFATNPLGTSYGDPVTFTTTSLSMSVAGALSEDGLDGQRISVTLSDPIWKDHSFDAANFSLTGAPVGLTVESVDYVDETNCRVNLAYDGIDFDSDKTGIGLTIAGVEFTTGNPLSSPSSLTISADNDPESIDIFDDGIYQGSENGEIITVILNGGTFTPTLTSGWRVDNLPAGVSKGTVTWKNKTTVRIALSGNATSAYGSDITNVMVTCPATDYNDSSGGGPLSATGLIFHAQTPPTVSTGSATSITATSATLEGNVISDGGAGIIERGIEYRKASETDYQKKPSSGTTGGSYNISLTALTSDTQYEYRAYAVNSRGTSYGEKKSFTTLTIPPSVDRNERLTIAEDSGNTTIKDKLAVTDSVQGPAALTFTLGTAPAKGTLAKDDTALAAGSTFTQADINNNLIKYTPNANANGDDSFTFTVSDGTGGTIGVTAFNITITAVNDPPVLAKNTGLTVNEDSAATAIGNTLLQATDVDHGDTSLVFTVTIAPTKGTLSKNGVAPTGTFTQDDINSGLIKYTPNADANGSDSFTFTVSDGAGGTIGATTFNITITAVNDPPILAKNTGIVVNEDSPATVIGNSSLQVTDVDHGDASLVFTVEMAPAKGTLSKNGVAPAGTFTQNDVNNNLIKYTPNANANGDDIFTFTVSDGAGGTIDATTFNITITAVNDASTDILLSATSVSENALSGTPVGTLSATDPDGDTSFTYTLVSGTGDTDNASFQISGSTLATSAVFDFETKSSYSIRVRVSDGGLFFEKQFTVTVTNLNEAPASINLSNNTVPENSAIGTTVGTLSATDPEGNSLSYNLPAGYGDNASFIISGTDLKTNAALDFEAQSSYNIQIRVTDSPGGLSFDQTFTITVTNVNEAPSSIDLSSNTVPENSAIGTLVGTFSATDPDGDTSFTYTLVPGTGDTDNASFQISGSNLLTSALFDFETKSSYSIRVRATDVGGLSLEKQLTVTVSNVNDHPTNILLAPAIAVENSAIGTPVGTFSATDPDGDTAFTYTLVPGTGDADNASFQISGSTLATSAVFDFETKSSYSIRVRATDGGGLFFEKQLTVTITNLNDPPTLIKNDRLTVSVNSAAVTITSATLAAADPDQAPDQVIFTLVTAPAKGQLQKSGATLALGGTFTQADLDNNRIAYQPHFSASGNDSFDFTVSDGAGASIDGSFAISIGSATFAADPDLAESNLNGSVLTVTLDGITFKDNSLAPANFILNNAPAGLTVQGTAYLNNTQCRITLAFSGVLDADVANLGLTIRGVELETNADLTASNTLSIVNDQTPPRLQTNAGLTLNADSEAVLITQAMLRAVDSEEAAASLLYTLETAPAKGTLARSGQPLGAGSAFTQADIDQSLISYRPAGNSGGTDSFSFTVSDGTNGGSISGSFAITINLFAIIAADQTLTETTLDGRSFTVALTGARFSDDGLTAGNFTLINAPAGLTVSGVTGVDPTHCRIALAFNGSFDSGVSLGLTVKAAALSSGADLTAANTLTIIDDLPAGKTMVILQPGGTSDNNAWRSAGAYQNDLWTDWDGDFLLLGKGVSHRKADVWLVNPGLIGSGQDQIPAGAVIDRAELVLKVKSLPGSQTAPRQITIYAVSDPDNLGQPYFGSSDGLRTGLDFRYRDHRLGRAIPWAKQNGSNVQDILEMIRVKGIAPLDRFELVPRAFRESGGDSIRLDIKAALQSWLSSPEANQGFYLTATGDWDAGEGIEVYGVNSANSGNQPYLRIVYGNGVADLTPPAAVTKLAATVSNQAVALTWTNPGADFNGARVIRKCGTTPVGPDDGTVLYDGPASLFADQGLTNGTPYYYAVFAYDAFRNYSPKAWVLAVPGDMSAPPAAPSDLTLTVSGTTVALAWADNSDNEDGFVVERREGGTWTPVVTLSNPNQTAYRDNGLTTGVTYYYQVKAYNASGSSAYADAGPMSADNRPSAPANLTWSIISASEVRLQWTDTANETSYRIEFRDGNGAPLSGRTAEPLPADTTQYSVMKLAPNVAYRFRVVAINASGEAASETELIMTMQDPKPGIF